MGRAGPVPPPAGSLSVTVRDTSDAPAVPDTSAAGAEFTTALAEALPRGFWSMPVLVGCSGGADSVALVVGLVRLMPPDAAGRLIVAHAEHDLRATAAADRMFVAALADRLGLRFVWRRLAVRDATDGPRGEGVEARARRLRYDFLAAAALDAGGRHVAVAHTADDQAETILQRMLRGTGLAGLGGMREARPLCEGVALVRPLLRLPRTAPREFLMAAGEPWREDESNADPGPARNFLRHEVLPRCAAGPFPAAARSLVRLGRQAELVAGALTSAAEHLLDAHASRQADGTVVLRTAALATLDPHLVAEVFAALWRREGWPRRDMTARHYARLADAAVARRVGTFDMPGGIRVTAAGRGDVRIVPSRPPRRD
jgi:tRNA(Ile)-lysidine synthase